MVQRYFRAFHYQRMIRSTTITKFYNPKTTLVKAFIYFLPNLLGTMVQSLRQVYFHTYTVGIHMTKQFSIVTNIK